MSVTEAGEDLNRVIEAIHRVEFLGGTVIDDAAAELVAAAKEHGTAEGSFNGILLKADHNSTAADIIADWDVRVTAEREAYRNSPEGIAAARERDERRAAAQQKHDALMQRLPTLNFTDNVATLKWLCDMQEPSDHSGVIVRRKTIVETFAIHGFTPGVNCGPDFRPESRDNVHRWLVGQALEGLDTGPAIHPIVHKFAAEWKAKFVRVAA